MPLSQVNQLNLHALKRCLPTKQLIYCQTEDLVDSRMEVNKNFTNNNQKLLHVGKVNSLGDTFELHENSICFANELRARNILRHTQRHTLIVIV